MATIKLTSGFSLIPEGSHVFKITDVDYKEAFGKIEVTMETATGQKHTERFKIMNKGEVNDGAMKAFSYFAKTALNDYTREEIDHTELIGHFIRCEVEHTDPQPNKNDPTKTVVFIRLGDKEPADGFDAAPEKKAEIATPAASVKPARKASVDLDVLLG